MADGLEVWNEVLPRGLVELGQSRDRVSTEREKQGQESARRRKSGLIRVELEGGQLCLSLQENLIYAFNAKFL